MGGKGGSFHEGKRIASVLAGGVEEGRKEAQITWRTGTFAGFLLAGDPAGRPRGTEGEPVLSAGGPDLAQALGEGTVLPRLPGSVCLPGGGADLPALECPAGGTSDLSGRGDAQRGHGRLGGLGRRTASSGAYRGYLDAARRAAAGKGTVLAGAGGAAEAVCAVGRAVVSWMRILPKNCPRRCPGTDVPAPRREWSITSLRGCWRCLWRVW